MFQYQVQILEYTLKNSNSRAPEGRFDEILHSFGLRSDHQTELPQVQLTIRGPHKKKVGLPWQNKMSSNIPLRLSLKTLKSPIGMRYLSIHPVTITKASLVYKTTTKAPQPMCRLLSTRTILFNRRDQAKTSSNKDEIHAEPPSASLESLGIGRNMRLFLFVVLGVFGTIETWFWCKAIWVWWKSRTEDSEWVWLWLHMGSNCIIWNCLIVCC